MAYIGISINDRPKLVGKYQPIEYRQKTLNHSGNQEATKSHGIPAHPPHAQTTAGNSSRHRPCKSAQKPATRVTPARPGVPQGNPDNVHPCFSDLDISQMPQEGNWKIWEHFV